MTPLDRAGRQHVAGLLEQRARRRSCASRRPARELAGPRGVVRRAPGRRGPWDRSRRRCGRETPTILTPRAASPSAACEPTLPKPWTIAVAPTGSMSERLHGAKGEEGDAVAGRLAPPERAAGVDRLAGDDLRHGDALVHRIGVHEPGHDLLVGAHVRRHDVDARADERDHLLHVAARQVLEFPRRQRARIDRDAALARRRRAVRRARISSSSRSPAPRSRRCRRWARSACRPWRARASGDAGRGSR